MQGRLAHRAIVYFATLTGEQVSPAALAIKNQVCPNCTPDRMLTAARAYGTGTICAWDPYTATFTSTCPTAAARTPSMTRRSLSGPSRAGRRRAARSR